MPHAPNRPCWRQGCPNYQPCPKHARHHRQAAQAYEERRGSSRSRGYGGKRWERLREQLLHRDGPTCKGCNKEGWTHADHIVPKKDGGADTLENLQGLCHRCHNVKTAGEREARRAHG